MKFIKRYLLSNDDLNKIHFTSLDILEKIGIKLQNDNLIKFLSNFNSIKIDHENKILKFSPELIEKSIKTATKKFKVYGRDKEKSADFGYDKVITSSSWGMPFVIDIQNNEKFFSGSKDIKEAVAVGDYLKYIDIVGILFRANEIPGYYRDVYEFGEAIKITTKPVGVWITNGESFNYIIEIYNLFLKSKEEIKKFPPFFYEFEPITPLTFPKDGLNILIKCSELNIPVCSGPLPQPISTGPATIAGSLALGNAEQLATLALTQLVNPGTPFMCGLQCNVVDPFSLFPTMTGSPENVLFTIAQIQLAKKYGFPIFLDNQITSSNQLDYQMGLQFGINTIVSMLLGAEFHGHAGIVGADQGGNILKLILDEEAVSYMKRINNLYDINEDTLAFNVIEDVGIGGNFLTHPHTIKHMKTEFWNPKIFNRDPYTVWQSKGAKSLVSKTMDFKEYIIKNHKPNYADNNIEKEINKIVNSAKIYLNK